MRVAAHLGIPFSTFDATELYRREIAEELVREYAALRTPNPDVLCNRLIKFGAFLAYALERGADAIATGHYARIEKAAGSFRLLSGADAEKDQSYFLWTLSQRELARTLFPLGDMRKGEVRALAARLGLPTAAKRDSQGLCFVGELDMKEFLSFSIPRKPGAVLTEDGRTLGEHDGLAFYTVGQRHGFRTFAGAQTPRLYVVGKDAGRNALIVSPEPLRSRAARRVVPLEGVRFVRGEPAEDEPLSGVLRYRSPALPCELRREGGRLVVLFAEPVLAAPGQSLVLYRGAECVGGGVVAEPSFSPGVPAERGRSLAAR